jgi:hypothetical protein
LRRDRIILPTLMLILPDMPPAGLTRQHYAHYLR